MPLIELTDVEKIYPLGNQQVTALSEFSLSIDKGEFTVLAGPSGSGKTTVLNLVGGIDQPTAGTVRIEGRDVGPLDPRALADFRLHHIGFIFQSYNLIPVLTAAENAEFTLMLQGVAKATRRNRIRELFKELGIAGLENRKPRDLSGGQQQRVAIARAMAPQPTVILADEPTANLDSQTAEELLDLMYRLNTQRHTTFIFSSHDPLVISRARRIIRLRDGRLEDDRKQQR
ncbi:ABC transporter, ATP-binding protein [Syntrophotalea carbinolica DSM 2380]|uniref:ABC transporter, ATP-binding protein n=1 Tax=Syntrophotalea carbinolica (strain DSM 2380 / NBRC 103641 / GraBd1) TaxID=338963 RepID=Q3A1Z3_SYNC1|nr:ABC transporter ATP-binding protein [Syntrophotalea carbinolica]ABA89614.1 ABC transporter, ATP-binding protein [Syntrophotalea carbinolica DSM 2380]